MVFVIFTWVKFPARDSGPLKTTIQSPSVRATSWGLFWFSAAFKCGFLERPSTRTFTVLPAKDSLISELICSWTFRSVVLRSFFTSSGMVSAILDSDVVPGRGEYLNTKQLR